MSSASATASTIAPPMPCTARATTSGSCALARPQASEASGEEDDADHEHAPVAVQVAEPAAEQEEAAAGQQVGVDDPDQRRLGEAEVGADRGQRDVDDRHVEHDHQHAEADDAEGEPAARAAVSASARRPAPRPSGAPASPCRLQVLDAADVGRDDGLRAPAASRCASLRSRSWWASSGCSTE